MPQIAASYELNARQPNFTRDQVQTLSELQSFGGWNAGDPRYENTNEANLKPIDLGHITFVVETNQHYTYVKIVEVDENDNPTGGYHYGWVVFDGAGGGEVNPGGSGTPTDPETLGLYTYFKSLVFKRGKVNEPPARPGTGIVEGQPDFGGTFTNPVPTGWSDGIPAAPSNEEKAIWMSTRIFSSGGSDDEAQQAEWTLPQIIADTEFRDFEFSEAKDNPGEPHKTHPLDDIDHGDGWSDVATEDTIWMAMRDCESGQYKQGSSWEIVKIKGEDGEQALKIRICGHLTSVDDLAGIENPNYLDAYIINGNVYVWDGDSWENSGPFKGEYDSSKNWAYLHIKYSDDGQSFTAFGGEVPGKWVGTYCDYNIQDSSNFNDYYWKAVGGGDGFGYEYIYKLTIDDQAPNVPDDHTNAAGADWEDFDFVPNNWTDDPGGIDATWRWCWVCYRVCINGHWSEFKGAQGKTAAEGGVAALYAHYGADAVASSASRSFMIFTWTSLNENADPKVPYVPAKLEDNVAKWNVLDNTLDLNSGQTWAWENDGQSGTWNVNPGNAQSKFLWMSTASFSEALEGQIVGHWSDPVRLTGDDGRNGTDGVDTAFGYHLCRTMEEFAALNAPVLTNTHDVDSFVEGSGWTDHPQGIGEHTVNGEKVFYPIEAASVGTYNKSTDTWSYGAPFIWARWGEDGIDGDGIEYMFYIATEEDVVKSDILDTNDNKIGENVDLENLHWLPRNEAELRSFLSSRVDDVDAAVDSFYNDHYNEWLPSGTGWTDDPSDVGPFQPYEFVSIRKFQYNETTKEGKWGFWSEPALWARYAKDGKAGRSVFTSFAFTRTIKNLATLLPTPQGGTVELPIPDQTTIDGEVIKWTDSIPGDSNAPVWMTSRLFDDSLTGEGTGWKTPSKLQDSPEFQVEYTNEEVWDTSALPSLNSYVDWTNFPEEGVDEPRWRQDALSSTGAHWGDIGEGQNDIVDPWWMITARRSNGVWSSWAIHKIKGEKGQAGTSISVKGSLDSYRDLGDPSGNPAGQVNHSTVSLGDCYVINGLLWIYDDNSTKTSPYSTDYVTDYDGDGQKQGDKYAGFSCQGQFKGEPGSNSWIHVRFANKSEDQSTTINSENKWYRYLYNSETYIEFTGSGHNGVVPGKYAGIAITHDTNIAPTSIEDYEWTEWRGDDIYGTEQIFTLSEERPETPTRPSNVTEADWFTFDYVPTVPISGTDPVEYQVWSDTPLEATPDAHCWVSTRRLSDPEDNGWNTPVIYSRYAHDGDNGIDGAVNEFAYHLGDRNLEPGKDLSKARKYVNREPSDTKTSGVNASWWASDESRDYCPADSEDGYWTDNPQGVSDEDGKRVEYYIYRTREYDDEHNKYVWTEWSPVKVWSSWGQKGHDGDGVEYIFTLTETFDTPANPTPSDKTVEVDGKKWEDYDFAPKVAISGTDPVEYQVWTDDPQNVGSTLRYQWVSMRRSHSDSEGNAQWSDFSDPVEWNRYTEDGKDGRTEEFVYFLSNYDTNDLAIKPTIDPDRAYKLVDGSPDIKTGDFDWQDLEDYVPGLGNPQAWVGRFDPTQYNNIWWSDNPLAISEEWPLEYQSSRFKKDGIWSEWSDPIPWSTWGKTGHDGDGVEYIFARTANKEVVPVLTNETGAFTDNNSKSWTDDDFVPRTSIPGTSPTQYLDWTDDPQGVTKDLRVEWVSIRKTYEGVWAAEGNRKCWSEPKIWKEYDDSILEEKVYHYGGKTEDPVLNQVWNFKGEKVNSEGQALQQLDGFIPSDVTSDPGTRPASYYTGEGDYDPEGWTPFKKGIDPDHKYEWEAVRTKNPDTGVWSEFKVSLYAAWGEDGDSVEFVFWMVSQEGHEWIQTNKGEAGIFPNSDDYEYGGIHYYNTDSEFLPYLELFGDNGVNQVRMRAQDDPSDIVTETPYVYSSKREKRHGEWQPFGPIFLYTQLLAMPEYACTLNLSEDMQGVAVSDEGTCFKTIGKHVGFSNEELNLRYGPSALIVGQVKVAPITRRYVNETLVTTVGNAVEVWNGSQGQVANAINISTYDTDNNLVTNTINVNVSKSEEFYFCWFSWSSSTNIVFGKKPDGSPDDLAFVIYAYGGVAENSTEKYGTATFTIHPIEGNEFYELDPGIGCDIFKKLKTTPFTKSSLEFWLDKKIQTENSYTYAYCNEEEWNASYQEGHDNVWIRYRGDESSTWYTARAAIPSDTHRLVVDTDDYRYSLVPGVFNDDGTPYLKFNMVLFDNNGPDHTIRNFFPDLMDGITIQIWVGDVLHDEEFIPVVYDGKKGKTGDFYKEEYAYVLQPGDAAPNPPAADVQLADPSETEANNVGVWLKVPISPTVTNRYLFACKRLNRYYGEDDEELGVHYGDPVPNSASAWETPFLFASRSVGTQGDPGRGISGRTEYYKWTPTDSAPAKGSGWTANEVPQAGENDKYLWNYEVIAYTSGTPTEDTPVELIGTISEDGRGITGVTEYYLWSDQNTGVTSGGVDGAGWYEADDLPDPTATQRYLWNYEVVSYDKDPLKEATVPAVIAINGISVTGITEYYQWTELESQKPSNSTETGWTATTIPAATGNQKYLWNFEKVSYSSGSPFKTDVALLTTLVKDGVSITSVDEYYYWGTAASSGLPSTDTRNQNGSDSGASSWWSPDNQDKLTAQISDTRKYLWNFEVINYSEGDPDVSVPVILSQNGTRGAVGNGISSITEYYLWTASSTLTHGSTNAYQDHTADLANPNSPSEATYGWETSNNSKWYLTPTYITQEQIASKGYKYLWNFEILSYTESGSARTKPAIIGTIGEDGRGIVSITEYYLWSDKDSVSQIPAVGNSSWKLVDQLSTPTGDQKYLWNYEAVVYTDSATPVNSTPIIISVKGDKGDDGKYSQFVYFRSRLELGSSYTIQENGTDSGNYGFYDGTNTTWTINADGEALPVFKYTRSSNTFVVSSIQANTSTSTSTYNPFRVSSTSISTVTDDPQGVNDTWRYEYESMGTFDPSTTTWKFSKPALHNYKATNGTNGDPGTREFCMYRAGDRSSNYTLSTNPTNVKALNQIGWVIDYNSVTTSDSNPVIWAISTGIPLNEADPGLSDTTNRTWSDPRVVFEKGPEGLAGPVVRGPIEWTNSSSRFWNSGDTEEDGIKYIDIVVYKDNYFRCKTSHTGPQTPPSTANGSSSYWAGANGQYSFIASDLLLATNAKIKFLTNRQLVLTYMDGTTEKISGGAMGGTGVNFWSGGQTPDSSDTKFTVDYQGNLISTAGTIGGWTINPDSLSATGSQAWNSTQNKFMPELPKLSITTTRTSSVSTVNMSVSLRDSGITGTYSSTPKSSSSLGSYSGTFNLDPQMLSFSGNYSSDTSVKDYTTTLTYSDITFDSSYDTQGTQFEDFLNISSVNGIQLRQKVDGSIYKEARLTKDRLEIESVYASSSIASSGNISSAGTISALDGFTIEDYARPRSVTSSIGMLPLRIAIVVDDFSTAQSMFSDSGTTWKFNGGDTGVSTSEYPTLSTSSLPTGGTQVVYLTSSSVHLGTGVVLKTNLTRVGNTIYIEI